MFNTYKNKFLQFLLGLGLAEKDARNALDKSPEFLREQGQHFGRMHSIASIVKDAHGKSKWLPLDMPLELVLGNVHQFLIEGVQLNRVDNVTAAKALHEGLTLSEQTTVPWESLSEEEINEGGQFLNTVLRHLNLPLYDPDKIVVPVELLKRLEAYGAACTGMRNNATDQETKNYWSEQMTFIKSIQAQFSH